MDFEDHNKNGRAEIIRGYSKKIPRGETVGWSVLFLIMFMFALFYAYWILNY